MPNKKPNTNQYKTQHKTQYKPKKTQYKTQYKPKKTQYKTQYKPKKTPSLRPALPSTLATVLPAGRQSGDAGGGGALTQCSGGHEWSAQPRSEAAGWKGFIGRGLKTPVW